MSIEGVERHLVLVDVRARPTRSRRCTNDLSARESSCIHRYDRPIDPLGALVDSGRAYFHIPGCTRASGSLNFTARADLDVTSSRAPSRPGGSRKSACTTRTGAFNRRDSARCHPGCLAAAAAAIASSSSTAVTNARIKDRVD